jgi:ornithine carbamoyltransferase
MRDNMSKTLTLLKEMIDENKITITEVLEACGYEVDVVCTDVWSPEKEDLPPDRYSVLIGYDEKIIAVKEFR